MHLVQKRINGGLYWYLVRSVRRDGKPRNVCVGYVGKERPRNVNDAQKIVNLRRYHRNRKDSLRATKLDEFRAILQKPSGNQAKDFLPRACQMWEYFKVLGSRRWVKRLERVMRIAALTPNALADGDLCREVFSEGGVWFFSRDGAPPTATVGRERLSYLARLVVERENKLAILKDCMPDKDQVVRLKREVRDLESRICVQSIPPHAV